MRSDFGLKTLKDFEERTFLQNDKDGRCLSFYNDLRQEAIKQVKHFIKLTMVMTADKEEMKAAAFAVVASEFSDFFNITPEELK